MTKHRSSDRDTNVVTFLHWTRTVSHGKPNRASLSCQMPGDRDENITKYSRNETILKISHLAKTIALAKAIAFRKRSVLGQKVKMPKTCQKPFYKIIRVVL